MSDVNIQSMIDSVQSNNTESADTAFKNAIMSKITTALDVKRVELASTVYNQANNNANESTDNGTSVISELFDSKYTFKKPSSFKSKEVFYTFNAEGVDIKVQYMSEYADPVLEDGNMIKVAFGRPLKSPRGWIKVDTEELLNVKNPMKVMSTVFETMTDFITRYFKEDSDKTLSFNFHGALTSDETNKDIDISDSKRSRIYIAILNKLPILKKYKMKISNLGEDGIEISNDTTWG